MNVMLQGFVSDWRIWCSDVVILAKDFGEKGKENLHVLHVSTCIHMYYMY